MEKDLIPHTVIKMTNYSEMYESQIGNYQEKLGLLIDS